MKLAACILAGTALASFAPGIAPARSADDDEQPATTRQAPAVSRDVFEKLEASQELVRDEDYDAALELLSRLLARKDLTDYERSNVLRYVGHAHYSAGRTEAAIRAFADVLDVPGLEERLRAATLYTLAQLGTASERHESALGYLDEWFGLTPEPEAAAYILRAQILYTLERYDEMIAPIREALSRSDAPKEDWYVLLNFALYQVEDYAGVRDVNKVLLKTWPKKRYWLYLANACRELGDDDGLVAAYDAAYAQGLLETEAELVTMAQLYLQYDVPYQAGKLLEKEAEAGRVAADVANLRLLSQAWTLAQENQRAVAPLARAAELDDNGDLYVRLANVYLDLGRYGECVDAAEAGLAKGGLTDPDYAQVSLGMCLFNLAEYGPSIRAFRRAAQARRSAQTAANWIRIVQDYIEREEHIAEVEELTRQRQRELAQRKASDERG